MNKTIELTQEGYEKHEKELADLINNKRVQNRIDIQAAREQGDLSENADYDNALNEQAKIEERISEIQHILKNAKILKSSEDDIVDFAKYVTILNLKNNRTNTYQIVGSLEANPLENKISSASALGRTILGKREGEEVTYTSDTGLEFTVKIIKITNTIEENV